MGQRIIMYRTKIENKFGRLKPKYSDRASEAQDWVDQGLKVDLRSFWYYGRGQYVPVRYTKWKPWKGPTNE